MSTIAAIYSAWKKIFCIIIGYIFGLVKLVTGKIIPIYGYLKQEILAAAPQLLRMYIQHFLHTNPDISYTRGTRVPFFVPVI